MGLLGAFFGVLFGSSSGRKDLRKLQGRRNAAARRDEKARRRAEEQAAKARARDEKAALREIDRRLAVASKQRKRDAQAKARAAREAERDFARAIAESDRRRRLELREKRLAIPAIERGFGTKRTAARGAGKDVPAAPDVDPTRLQGDQLRALMASGQLRLRNPDDPELRAAMEASQRFHGTPHEVLELNDAERRLPKYVVVLGEMPETVYEPDAHSKRGGIIWEHDSGDRGDGLPRAKGKPTLCADPATGRRLIVDVDDSQTFNPDVGIVG